MKEQTKVGELGWKYVYVNIYVHIHIVCIKYVHTIHISRN